MNKADFSSSTEYVQALAKQLYTGQSPIDPKLSGECQADKVAAFGPDGGAFSIGACALAPNCGFANKKVGGVTGYCLKQVVGVDTDTHHQAQIKIV